MSDSAFKTAAYPGYSTGQLRDMVLNKRNDMMEAEIARRERVAAGDITVMTDGERLRFARKS
ncbi:hypothetical protein EOB36_31380 [Mesorhizobium sp. M6A.T.Cr.TU.017.01.1.1]|uniref:hypothetical protein n=1 Tax=Mesorhizobium sp. M6A.T.Cr.TU.017.01.1.1 TaxID=2496774 RepID=UPI000FD5BFEC|nr:hypothetical protein [Mesorhizobium sp. M6A.T.Cr.TU.017.01.1.1]RUU95885.1 hypothetical protein EOB36_31380 [Mesorhizobium sp. M6A.T.Cr.TU.017.01.1.1]